MVTEKATRAPEQTTHVPGTPVDLDRLVAIKTLLAAEDDEAAQSLARFKGEAQALARLNHPNIVPIFEYDDRTEGFPFMVMEFVDGGTLRQKMDDDGMQAAKAVEYVRQILDGLSASHAIGVIHRDIKPSNILVTLHDGVPVPKVIDFGIAKATSQLRLTDRTLFTAFAQFIGTPAYMSPEQAEGGAVDTRSDLYSLGATLYHLLAGQPPFGGTTSLAVALAHVRDRHRPLPEVRGDLPERRHAPSLFGRIDADRYRIGPRNTCW